MHHDVHIILPLRPSFDFFYSALLMHYLCIHTACTCLVHTPVEFELQHGFLELPRASCSVTSQCQASAQDKTTHQHQSSQVMRNCLSTTVLQSSVCATQIVTLAWRQESGTKKTACFQERNTTNDGQVIQSNLRALSSARATENEPKKLKSVLHPVYEISCTGDKLCNTNMLTKDTHRCMSDMTAGSS